MSSVELIFLKANYAAYLLLAKDAPIKSAFLLLPWGEGITALIENLG
jgi:hypothetical protein